MAARRRARAAPLWLLAAAASLLVVAASATGRPGANGCTSSLVSLSPCVDYMSGIGSEATALGRCCRQLRSVARSMPQCLCAALRVDRTRALSLPAACIIQNGPALQRPAVKDVSKYSLFISVCQPSNL